MTAILIFVPFLSRFPALLEWSYGYGLPLELVCLVDKLEVVVS